MARLSILTNMARLTVSSAQNMIRLTVLSNMLCSSVLSNMPRLTVSCVQTLPISPSKGHGSL